MVVAVWHVVWGGKQLAEWQARAVLGLPFGALFLQWGAVSGGVAFSFPVLLAFGVAFVFVAFLAALPRVVGRLGWGVLGGLYVSYGLYLCPLPPFAFA